MHPFKFGSLVYNGFDFMSDGIGNHLALLDELVFRDLPAARKSLHEIFSIHAGEAPYGKVESGRHLTKPDLFKNCLFLDVARETWNLEAMREQIRWTIEHKRTFNAVTAIYLMWESDRLFELYTRLVRAYDVCIVTSDVLQEYLRDQGVNFIKLRHPYRYHCELDSLTPALENPPVLTFGITAGLWKRKNVSLLAETFARVMGNDSRYRLSIHTRFVSDDETYRPELERVRKVCRDYRNIELLAKRLTRGEYLHWMRGLDVYCFISSGEGYSVTPREALHLGKPVILHDAHVHREIIDLPGVIPVKCAGRQKASTSTNRQDCDVGEDWKLDVGSLENALRKCIHEYPSIRNGLIRRRREIVSRHAVEGIRSEWVAALNTEYERHIDSVSLDLPELLSSEGLNCWKDLPKRFDLQAEDFKHGTGSPAQGRIYCLRTTHQPGHCLYGPSYRMSRAERLKVEFRIDFLGMDEEGGEYISLDVYDNASGEILVFRAIDAPAAGKTENHFLLEFDAVAGQSLEFRVYWHANCDICVTGVKLFR